MNQKNPDGLKPDGKPYRILVIDDSNFIIKQLSQILMSEKYDICATANTGEEGLAKYKEQQPDLVTMDITMPGDGGLATLPKILEYNANAKIIMVSSHGNENVVKDALVRGAKNFIVKPFDRNTVLERIKSALS